MKIKIAYLFDSELFSTIRTRLFEHLKVIEKLISMEENSFKFDLRPQYLR